MTHSQSKRGPKARGQITLSASRDIPFDKLVLSQSNVWRIKAGVSIEELAADISRRTLLQSLTVRPVLDDDGAETGMFEIPAGGRRYRALELLVQRKQLARTAPVPCVIRTERLAEEDSLAENIQRAPLHPLDQFPAFLAMREKGMGEEEIAVAFFVSSNAVRQRLRMAAVSPALLEVYAEDGMSLEQLMAFTLNPDHARQDQVWEAIQQSWSKETPASKLATVVNGLSVLFPCGTHACWQLVVNDRTGAPTLTDMGASFGIATGGEPTLFIAAPPDAGSVWVRLANEVSGAVLEQEITAYLPANTQLLSPRLFTNNGTRAAAVACDCSGIYVGTDY